MSHNFKGKVLLFGEYGIIKGSKGLAFPLSSKYGTLTISKDILKNKQALRLDEFCEYLQGSSILSKSMDLESFKDHIAKGSYFNSNIPFGYGVGSSGALCAAIYAKYGHDFNRKEFYDQEELNYLKDIMALMESFYHGTSSGIDCLISLVDKPLLIESRNKIRLIDPPDLSCVGDFFLFDSGASRTTSSFVHSFLEKYDSDSRYQSNINTFIEQTNKIIDELLDCKEQEFKSSFYELSRLQYLHFSQMIPEDLKNKWLEGLESKEYFMKLCGAGGGGYFIVYTNDGARINKFKKDKDYIKI